MRKVLIFVLVMILMCNTLSGCAYKNDDNDPKIRLNKTENQQTSQVVGDSGVAAEQFAACKDSSDQNKTLSFVELNSLSAENTLDAMALGDINQNGIIDSMDYVLLKRAYFGTYELNEQSSSSEEEIIDPYSPTFENYEDYVRYLETITLPDHFVSYEDLSEFGEFDGFVSLDPNNCKASLYSFIDESGAEFAIYVYCPPRKGFGIEYLEISDEQINASDMRTPVIIDSEGPYQYTYQGITYTYWKKSGKLGSISWQCGDINYILSDMHMYPTTDKNTLVNRLLNLETALEVISNLKSYTLKTNN